MGGKLLGSRPVVLFFDQDAWNPFLQLAAALRRAHARPVCLQTETCWRTTLLGRVGYGTVLHAEHPRDLRRLKRLIHEGRMLDVHLNELNVAQLERTSECASLLRLALGSDGAKRWSLLDKLEVSGRLRAGGVAVPPFVGIDTADGPSLEQAVSELGYPVMVKRRISSGGAGVRLVSDRASLAPAVAALMRAAGPGSPEPPLFAERYLVGEIVQYAALVGRNGVEHETCLSVQKAAAAPFAPSVSVVTIDDAHLRDTGRKAVELLGCAGLVNLEFIRDREGRLWHIDLATRAYGNVAALADSGVNMLSAYLSHLGLTRPHAVLQPAPRIGTRIDVFPTKMLELKGRVGLTRALRASLRDLRSYLHRFGSRYMLAAAFVIIDGRWRAERERRRQTA